MKFAAIVLLTGLLFVAAASAQGRNLSRVEFDKVVDAAFEASGKKNRREVTSIGSFENGKAVQTSIMLEEYLPPGRSRWRSTDDIAGNKSSAEMIVIDGQRYLKSALGYWFKVTRHPDVKTAKWTDEQNAVVDKQMTYTWKTYKHLGKDVKIYQRVYTAPVDDAMQTSTFIVHIDDTGLILRREQNTVDAGKGNYKKEVTTYDYDPKGLKIEAPIK